MVRPAAPQLVVPGVTVNESFENAWAPDATPIIATAPASTTVNLLLMICPPRLSGRFSPVLAVGGESPGETWG